MITRVISIIGINNGNHNRRTLTITLLLLSFFRTSGATTLDTPQRRPCKLSRFQAGPRSPWAPKLPTARSGPPEAPDPSHAIWLRATRPRMSVSRQPMWKAFCLWCLCACYPRAMLEDGWRLHRGKQIPWNLFSPKVLEPVGLGRNGWRSAFWSVSS